MKDSEICIGDVLRVREWDDLIREFGMDLGGNVKTTYSFVSQNKYLCGQQVEIIRMCDGTCGSLYECIVFGISTSESDTFYFSADELEALQIDNLEVATDEEIKLLFG